jgi:nickel-dependent lactate racemase
MPHATGNIAQLAPAIEHSVSSIWHSASSPEDSLETTLHPIAEISNRIQLAGSHRVHLSREVERSSAGTAESAVDVVSRVRHALQEPVDFPPLSAAIVPGDRIAIPIDDDVPHVGLIARGVVEAFTEAGIDAESIDVVATNSETIRLCREDLEPHVSTLPNFVVHDPGDEKNLCMVGLNKKKEPLTINRTIFDADVVLPISSWRPGGGAFSGLFPGFPLPRR